MFLIEGSCYKSIEGKNVKKLQWYLKYASLLFFIGGNISAQTSGTFLPVKHIEVGFSYKMFQREFVKEFVSGKNHTYWDIPAAYGKYRVNEWINVNIEGAVYLTMNNEPPGRNYINYHIGGGYEVQFLKLFDLNILSVVQLDYNVNHDWSKNKVNKNQQYLFIGLKAEKVFTIDNFKTSISLIPAYIYNKLTNESAICTASSETKNNFGAALGVSVLASENFNIGMQVVYANYFQPQIAIGYVF